MLAVIVTSNTEMLKWQISIFSESRERFFLCSCYSAMNSGSDPTDISDGSIL